MAQHEYHVKNSKDSHSGLVNHSIDKCHRKYDFNHTILRTETNIVYSKLIYIK